MFLTSKKCEGLGDCVEKCPTEAIRLVEGKAFSCITCGTCYKVCPNNAISINKYGGYVVDRSKCNSCGVCAYNCPTGNIHIEDGITYGICSRCGVCMDSCSLDARVDGFEVIEGRQLEFLESLSLLDQNKKFSSSDKPSTRACMVTDTDKCVLCGRCQYYCPTNAIMVDNKNSDNLCTRCRVCSDVCPVGAIEHGEIDYEKCTLCLKCLKSCPNDAILVEDFKVSINKNTSSDVEGSIVSCLNCGLCSENSKGALKRDNKGKLSFDPSIYDEDDDIQAISDCPVNILREVPEYGLEGYCVLCGKCKSVCDREEARDFKVFKWDGSVSEDCISCGTCAEVCPEGAIILKHDGIDVDSDKCILCETCAIHCPVEVIPKTTILHKEAVEGFNIINQNNCIQCELCLNICPEEAIKKVDDNIIINEEECIYCGACKNICPAKAILFERTFQKKME